METAQQSQQRQQRMSPQAGGPRPPGSQSLHPAEDFVEYLREYAKQNPEMAALCCFGVGFVLGWKLKPW